jgi:hypothetical protein
MIILLQSTSEQSISFIPRVMDATSLVIRNESTNEEVILMPDFYKNDYYITCNIIFDLQENHFYQLSVFNNEDIVYLDKIFCTNQTINTYTINKDTYVTATGNTIIYE